jgi:hypothetical protein
MKRKMGLLQRFIMGVGVIFLGSVTGSAQTPTLSLARGNSGISDGEAGRASNFEFQMESAGWPHAVTAGETVFMFGSWPNGNNPTITDDKSNTWNAAGSCGSGDSMTHGFFYAINAAANTSTITTTHGSAIGNQVFDWAHFYNMSTTTSGFVDASSCKTGVTPANNGAPNISGTAYTTTTNGDLILVCVYVEGGMGTIYRTGNAISSITWPAGFIGLNEDTFYGHACAYGVQATAGSFTPTFTVAQGAHSTFTIMSGAFKAGSGGSAPGNGAAILLSEVHYATGSGQTDTVNLPCPSGTTAVAVADDAASITGVGDSGSSNWQSVSPPGNNYGPIFYANNPTIANGNTYTINMAFRNSGNYDLVGLYCLGNTNGIDTGVAAKNSSTLVGAGSGATYGGGQSGGVEVDAPSMGTASPGDLIIAVGAIGVGPASGCVAGQCVFDYVGSTSWNGSAGDNQSYSNGDTMAHQYASTASTAQFEYNLYSGGVNGSAVAIAFKAGSTPGAPAPPAPPTKLQATVVN